MALDSDILLDRENLKKKITKWQIAALVIALIAVLALVKPSADLGQGNMGAISGDYIAKVAINGVITSDSYRQKVLKEIEENDRVKAVILEVDSPGGTTSGGEDVFFQVRKISESGKPVAVVMKTLATSAGYMVAVAGDRVIARNGTITGSIGVLVQSAEFTELAENLGIKFESFKSSPLKANPSPTEKTEPKAAAAMKAAVLSFYDYFVDLVAERRAMPRDEIVKVADGRIFTGIQAMELGLIDELGGQDEALKWLQEEKKIADTLKVEEISTTKPENNLGKLLFGGANQLSVIEQFNLSGMLSIWKP